MKTALALLLILLAGCAKMPPKEQERRYPLRGVVVRLDSVSHLATIKHDKIGDWMEAMTMEFPVESKDEFAKLREGEKITATVVVRGIDFKLVEVKEDR